MVAPLIVAAMTPFVTDLFAKGLSLLGNAVLEKGKAAVEEKLGVKLPAENTPLTAEQAEAMRKLQFEHEEALLAFAIKKEELAIEATKVDYAEMNSARDLGKTLVTSDSWLNKHIVALLAIGAILGGISMMLLSKEPDVRMAGLSIAMLPLGYYFGTSASSKSKDAVIQAAAARGNQ